MRALLGALALSMSSLSAHAAITTFTDEAAFLLAAGGGLSTDDFESSTFDGTTIGFSAGSINCTGDNFCDTFFGNMFGGGLALSGVKAPFFGTPDTLTFQFDDPLNAFGIFIGGSGDVGTQTLSFMLSDGSVFTPFPDYTSPSGTFDRNTLFFGFLSDVFITSIAVSGSPISDGVFFDDLYFGADDGVIPIPASVFLFGAGLAGLVAARRRKASA